MTGFVVYYIKVLLYLLSLLNFDVFLGITKYADILVAHYSGGNKRKLSLAVALVGFSSKGEKKGVILLDEPTSGVDPLSRKLLHNVIQQATKAENSVVLSSHRYLSYYFEKVYLLTI